MERRCWCVVVVGKRLEIARVSWKGLVLSWSGGCLMQKEKDKTKTKTGGIPKWSTTLVDRALLHRDVFVS
jgi:hypothetical protein